MTSNYTITRNETFKSLEIKFNTIPSETIREALKALKFRWNRVRGLWYGDGGMIAHIRAHGEWCRTHDVYGHEIKDPEDTNDIITFADFLKRSIA